MTMKRLYRIWEEEAEEAVGTMLRALESLTMRRRRRRRRRMKMMMMTAMVMMTLMVMMMAAVMVVMATMAQMCCSHLDIQSRQSLMDGYEDFFICILFLLQPCRLQLCTFASKNLNQSQLSSSP